MTDSDRCNRRTFQKK